MKSDDGRIGLRFANSPKDQTPIFGDNNPFAACCRRGSRESREYREYRVSREYRESWLLADIVRPMTKR